MKQNLFVLGITILFMGTAFAGCGRKEQRYPSYDFFPEEKKLTATVLELDTVIFRYPFRVAVKDSLMLVLDLHNFTHYLHAFNWQEGKHLASFGRRGSAPGEMLSGETIRFVSPDSIWTLDANKMEISRWQLVPSERRAEQVEVVPVDKQMVRALDFFPVDSGFFIPDYMGEHRFSQLTPAGRYLSSTGTIPTETDYTEYARPALAQAWRSFLTFHPERNRLALATQLGEVLEIYDLNDGTSVTRYGPGGEPQFSISGSECIPTGIMGFSDIQATDRYIYAVFHGRTFDEILKTHQQGGEPEDGGRFIYVFDWEGNPIRRYILDRAVYGIFVDEKAGFILATDVNHDEPIVSFRL